MLLAAGAKARLNNKNMESDTLVYTLLHGDPAMARYLIEKGVDAASAGVKGDYSPLQCAAMRGYDDLVEIILARGADVNQRCGWARETPLMCATASGRATTITLLARHGADVNLADEEGKTALGYAVDKGAGEAVVMSLLKAGANPACMHGKNMPVSLLDYVSTRSNKWFFSLFSRAQEIYALGQAEEQQRRADAESAQFCDGSAGNIRVASPLKLKRAPKAMI